MSTLGFMFCFYSRAADIKFISFFIILFLFSSLGLQAAPPKPIFSGDQQIGQSLPYLTLSWSLPDAEPVEDRAILFELQMARSPDFTDTVTHYRGPDRASFVSGLAEGDYFFRIRSFYNEGPASGWTDAKQVTVEYQSLAQAFVLFGIGALVSIATIALVVTGDRRTRREEMANLR